MLTSPSMNLCRSILLTPSFLAIPTLARPASSFSSSDCATPIEEATTYRLVSTSFFRCLPTLFLLRTLGRFLTYIYPAYPEVKSGGFDLSGEGKQWNEGTLLFLGFSDKVRDHVEVWF